MGQLVDIEAAGGNIGGDQNAYLAGLEIRQRLGARTLALVAVDRGGGEAVFIELLGKTVGAVLGAGKYQHLFPVVGANQIRQQLALALAVDRVNHLGDQLGGGVAARHFDQRRGVEDAVCQRLDLFREGGGEQQVLALLGQQGQHFADIVDKAHVEHAVGFVKDEDFNFRQVEGFLVDVVEQATRRGDKNIHPAAQHGNLRVDVNATENHRRAHRQVLAVGGNAFTHLGSQFACRGKHQGAHRTETVAHILAAQALQQGQGKTGGFAGAGLCAGQHVAAFKHNGDGLGLDRGGFAVALF